VSQVLFASDETDAFNMTSTAQPLPAPPSRRLVEPSSLLGAGPTVHYRSVARLAYVTDDPKPDFNGRTMRCVAIQSGFAKVVATATLIVRRTYFSVECAGYRGYASPQLSGVGGAVPLTFQTRMA